MPWAIRLCEKKTTESELFLWEASWYCRSGGRTRTDVNPAYETGLEPPPGTPLYCTRYGIRTRDFAVKGQRLNRLSNRAY
jgi:hypothetical protein